MAQQGSTNPFYKSKEWYKARNKALIQANFTCAMCGISVHGKGNSRVDHIIPLDKRPDLALVPSNLRCLCPGCDNRRHREKSWKNEHKPQIGLDGYPAGW
jgi:5-methylcytosine-specific restriction endonuclease McrA